MNCTAKKQDVSNVAEKNDIKLVTKKKIKKEYRSSSVDDSDESVGTEHSLFFTNFKYKLRMEFNTMKISDPQSA